MMVQAGAHTQCRGTKKEDDVRVSRKYPEENIQYSNHGESLKSRIRVSRL